MRPRLIALATVVVAAAIAVGPARSQTAVPQCAPGGPAVNFAGQVSSADVKGYRELAFEVAPGTTRVELTYDWADIQPALPSNPITQTVFDLGLWDQDGYRTATGFRGWSGSRAGRVSTGQPPIFVQQDVAQRGYLPDPIEPGRWYADLGIAAVGPSGATWTVTVTCRSPAVGAPFVSTPVDPAHVANAAPGWYRGDFHMHGFHSNLRAPSWQSMVDEARAAGLDFLPITDYVTGQHWRELGPVQDANPDVVIWPSREIITYYGHAIALGETPHVLEYRHGFEDVTLAGIQAQVVADGALFGVAHPTIFPGPVFANFCRGCEFTLGDQIDWDQVTTLEVLTSSVISTSDQLGLPELGIGIQNPFMLTALLLWDQLLGEGHKITAVSGSDSKGVEPADRRWGANATAVFARELSRPALKEALRAGHAYVQARGALLSPALEMEAVTEDGQRGMFGDTLYANAANVTVTVTKGQGQFLQVIRNGLPAGLPVPITSDPFVHTFTADRGLLGEGPLGTYWRIQTFDLNSITTVGNPVFLVDPARRPAANGPGETAAPASSEAGGRSATLPATGASSALFPGLALLALGLGWRRTRTLVR